MDIYTKKNLVGLALHEYWDAVTTKVTKPRGMAVLLKDGTMISAAPLLIKAYDPEAVAPKATWQRPLEAREYTYPATEVLNTNLIHYLCKKTDERPLPKLKDILQAVVTVTPHKGATLGYTVKITENPTDFSGLVDPPRFPL